MVAVAAPPVGRLDSVGPSTDECLVGAALPVHQLVSDFALIAAWRRHLAARELSPETIRLYTTGVSRFMAEHVEGPPAAATEDHVDAFLAGIGRRSSTRAQYALALRSFFGWCLRRGYVSRDPTAAVRVRKPVHLPAVVLEEDELVRYMVAAAWRDPRRAWAIMLTFSIGCRRGELAGISPSDVLGDRVLLRRTKGGRPRIVELNALAERAITELRPWWTEDSILGGVVPQTITEWCHEAAEDAGLLHKVRRRPSHVLRASFATHLLRQGTPIHVVKELMGHRDISTTASYLALASGEKAAAVSRLPFAQDATLGQNPAGRKGGQRCNDRDGGSSPG